MSFVCMLDPTARLANLGELWRDNTSADASRSASWAFEERGHKLAALQVYLQGAHFSEFQPLRSAQLLSFLLRLQPAPKSSPNFCWKGEGPGGRAALREPER
jgi:hypothetical protein